MKISKIDEYLSTFDDKEFEDWEEYDEDFELDEEGNVHFLNKQDVKTEKK